MDASNRSGYQTVLLKAFRAKDFDLQVVGRSTPTRHTVKLRFSGGGLLDTLHIYPTVWLRLWFRHNGKPHMRAFTIIEADPANDEFSLLFALHDGPAANWARAAQPGDRMESTLLSSKFAMPDPSPDEYLLIGDIAALPAINTILDQIPYTPARIWLEHVHESDRELDVHTTNTHRLEWIPRQRNGKLLVETVASEVTQFSAPKRYAWVACDTVSTRSIVRELRSSGFTREQIKYQAYWR